MNKTFFAASWLVTAVLLQACGEGNGTDGSPVEPLQQSPVPAVPPPDPVPAAPVVTTPPAEPVPGAPAEPTPEAPPPAPTPPVDPPVEIPPPAPVVVTPQAALAWGDSLSGDLYPGDLASISGRQVIRMGVGSQNSSQIAGRVGSSPAHLTMSGNALTESGDVRVDSYDVMPAYNTSVSGSLADVSGKLGGRTDANGGVYYVFTRTDAGSTTAVPAGTLFLPSTDAYKAWINIFWMGRNDAWDTAGAATVKSKIQASVNWVDPSAGRTIVMTILNGNYGGEYRNQSRWVQLQGINDWILATYPDNAIDIRRILIDEGLQRAGIPPTDGDQQDIANDIPPRSLRKDSIHLNAAGQQVVAEVVNGFIQGKGW